MQASLFGEPSLNAALSQWFTPPWLARRLAKWVPRGARILEPSCGSGNILAALLRAGHSPTNLTGIEIDPRHAEHARQALNLTVPVLDGDFLTMGFPPSTFDVIVGNFPFEANAHMHFTLRALQTAPVVIAVYPVSFEFGKERDRELWATKGLVTRRARLPERVDYGGDQSPSFDSVVLEIAARKHGRQDGEWLPVREEVWLS